VSEPRQALSRTDTLERHGSVSGTLDCIRELADAPVHLADHNGPGALERPLHAAHDLDLVALGVDLHDIGYEVGPQSEIVVYGNRLDANEAFDAARIVGRNDACRCRMPCIEESIPARIRHRLLDDDDIREQIELDVAPQSLAVLRMWFEGDHRPRRPNEARTEQREEPDARAYVEEHGAGLDESYERLLHIQLRVP
jgi:hypothetical protein